MSTTIEIGYWRDPEPGQVTPPSGPGRDSWGRTMESYGTITAEGTQLRYCGNVAELRATVREYASGRNLATYPGGLAAFVGWLGAQIDDGYTWARFVADPAADPAAATTDTAAAAAAAQG